ncbi:MAG: M14-type cytosolic carboxypeptidase [Alphaproteobacteria bacterium]
MPLHISSNFDSGNIVCASADDPSNIRLEISKDNNSDFYMWFHFRLTGAKDTPCTLNITNAKGAAYPKGWEGYQAVASTDRENWVRVSTTYENGILSIRHTPSADSTWFAYFAPYSMERHADLIAQSQLADGVSLDVLGETLDGQPMDLLRIGEPAAGKQNYWAIARQHPGESMAEWWMEGFLARLLDPADRTAQALREKVVFHIVPNMNPDGSRRGHLRTNASGANLNREWSEPAMDRSPEVFLVRERMKETGADFCLDVHGDEALPYNFLAGMMGIPSLSDRQKTHQQIFSDALLAASPDFQTKYGYPDAKPGKGNMTLCSNWVAEEFGCLALTLEMPFKDNADHPDATFGWSPARTKAFGAAHLDAMLAVLNSD